MSFLLHRSGLARFRHPARQVKLRYGTAHGVDHDRGRERVTLQEAIEIEAQAIRADADVTATSARSTSHFVRKRSTPQLPVIP